MMNPYLVGGLEHEFYDFPFSWEFHHHPTVTHSYIFPRGRLKPPTNDESLLYQGVDLGNWSDHQQWGETLKNNGIAVQQCMFLPCPNYKP